jgi:uncharacterized protein
MLFEWDARKAALNEAKHGVTFDEAVTVFLDARGLDWSDPRHSTEREKRGIRIGFSVYSRILMAVYTERRRNGAEETIRIISARRANRKERGAYLGQI